MEVSCLEVSLEVILNYAVTLSFEHWEFDLEIIFLGPYEEQLFVSKRNIICRGETDLVGTGWTHIAERTPFDGER